MGGDVVETLWHEGGYALIVYHSAEEVRALTPDLAALSEGDILYIATAPGTGDPSGADVVSRAFAPGAGIPEDPVTGSAHSVLTPYWTTRLGRDAFAAYQARSEEHTSELQSLMRISYAVFCLKKKKTLHTH